MITSIDVSEEIFATDMLKALKSSLKHRRKHVLRPLQLCGDQALAISLSQCKFPIKEFLTKIV